MIGLPLDVGALDRIDAVVDVVTERWGAIHILVSNAAVNYAAPIWDYPLEQWQRTLDVNLTGAWYLCRQVMPSMRAAGGGSIVNVSSGAVETGGGFGTEPV